MSALAVWAPLAERVELQLAGRRVPMVRGEGGWWSADVDVGAGADYAFCVDGGDPLPDPRSPWQPQGVHGPSRRVDHGAFAWTDARWQAPPLAAALIYELHVGTFTPEGTFDGVIGKLGYLRDLGVSHIELMPVNAFPGVRGWGYDGVDLYAPHDAYGGPDGLKRLVDACHRLGLGVILDVVYNHLGPEGAYLGRFGPYLSEGCDTAWGPAVNLDGPHSDGVRAFVVDNARMWLRDYHLDGLRLDAVHALVDTSAMHILEELAAATRDLEASLGRHLVLIAESNRNDPRIVTSWERGGYGIDAQWSDDLHHAIHTVLTGECDGYYRDFGTLEHLTKALEDVFVYDGRYSPYRMRRRGRPVGDPPADRFITCLQNHDQVGNRARGERIGHLVGARRLQIGAALALMAPTVPLLFQGEEWAAGTPFQFFTDYQDPALAEAVRAGRRREFAAFGWDPADVPDPQAVETFARSSLDWGELRREPHAGILDWYRRLIHLRRTHPDLAAGRRDAVRAWYDEEAQWLAYTRGRVTVACNLAERPTDVPLPAHRLRRVLLASDTPAVQDASLALPPESVAILGP